MNLILTMAGKYSRFRDDGFNIPKYLLPYGNRSILSEILHNLLCEECFDNVYLIANKEDEIYFGHIKKIMESFDIPISNLISIGDTSGQAETCYIGIKSIPVTSGPIAFHNIDTILLNRNISDIKSALSSHDGYIDIFESNNHEYSYVILDDNIVTTIAEKILVSNTATSGFYGFASADLFLQYYDNELYISDVYRKMISDNKKISTGDIYNESETIVLGTPSNYLKMSQEL